MEAVAAAPSTPLWAKALAGVGVVAVIGGVVYYVTRDDDDDDDDDDEPKALPPARRPARKAPKSRGRPRQRGGGRRPRPRGRDAEPPRERESAPPPPPSGPDRPAGPPPKRQKRRRRGGGGGGGGGSGGGGLEPPVPVPSNGGSVAEKLAGGTERRNAAIAVVAQPDAYPQRNATKQPSQSQGDWLADVAYWSTYPNAPPTLDPNDKSHARFIKSWLRIRAYVGRGLSLLPQLGEHPVRPGAGTGARDNWHRWALAVAFASPLRTASALRTGFKKAWHYVIVDPKGVSWQHHQITKRPGGQPVTLEGLMADVAVWMSQQSFPEAHRTLSTWPQSMTKAFGSANKTAESK